MVELHQKIDNCLYLEDIKSITREGVLVLFDWYENNLSAGSSLTVRKTKVYIHDNYDRRLPLSELADHVQLNPQYLSVLFKKETGSSISDYLSEIRISKAKALLRNTNITILEAAETVGYADARYFSRVFKTRVGMRPTEYRKAASEYGEGFGTFALKE